MATDRDMIDETSGAIDGNMLRLWLSLPCSEGGEKPILRGESRREEWLLSWRRVCVSKVGAFDDLSEGVLFRLPSPQASVRPKSY
jgi:hypothetical protein